MNLGLSDLKSLRLGTHESYFGKVQHHKHLKASGKTLRGVDKQASVSAAGKCYNQLVIRVWPTKADPIIPELGVSNRKASSGAACALAAMKALV